MIANIVTPFSKEDLIPLEEKLEVKTNVINYFTIGIPKETHIQEKRVLLTPDAVSFLVNNGHKVIIESGAGLNSHYSDSNYSSAGAKIVYNPKEAFKQQIIAKIMPPTIEEIELLQPKSFLISSLLINSKNSAYFKALSQKKITAIGFEYIKDEMGHLTVSNLISEIAGTASILIASELLFTHNNGNGLLLGGVTGVRPTEIVIIGCGTVGLYACKAALGLGASVKVFDNSLSKLRQFQDKIGSRIFTSIIDPKELQKALMRCDVAIGAVKSKGRTPIIISEEMVMRMKPGSIIMDLSVGNGGCFETSEITTHQNPTFVKHNVIHYGVTNITSIVARTTTKALSNFFLQYLNSFTNETDLNIAVKKNSSLVSGIYLYNGYLTKKELGILFGLPCVDVNLLTP
ncbi:MAG: alanine dehydrogenase [Solirubrobacteraceae bacterium]